MMAKNKKSCSPKRCWKIYWVQVNGASAEVAKAKSGARMQFLGDVTGTAD